MKHCTKTIVTNKLLDQARNAHNRARLARNDVEKKIFEAKAAAYIDASSILKKEFDLEEKFYGGEV